MTKPAPYSHILIMKAGPHCGYSLDEIIQIKQKEQQLCGKFFWGYGGVFCRPNALQGFISHAKTANQKITVLFVETKSSYSAPKTDRFAHFSTNSTHWQKLSKDVLLVGNKAAAHFAITAKNLHKVSLEIDLGKYCHFSGMFANPNKQLSSYFRGRVDKTCGLYSPKAGAPQCLVNVAYQAELTEPYCVYIK